MKTSSDALIIGGVELHSRLFIGTGKYGSDGLIPAVAGKPTRKSQPWRCGVWISATRKTMC